MIKIMKYNHQNNLILNDKIKKIKIKLGCWKVKLKKILF
jgi:hypothetical protein